MSTKSPYFRENAEAVSVVVPGVCSVTHIDKQEVIPFALRDILHFSWSKKRRIYRFGSNGGETKSVLWQQMTALQ